MLDNVDSAQIAFVTRGQSDFIEVENWTIPFTNDPLNVAGTGALKLSLNVKGVELDHLFEIGQ